MTTNAPRPSRLRPLVRAALCLTAALGAVSIATSAQAQAPVLGAGWSGGGTYVTEMNSDASDGARSLEPGTGFVFGIFVDRWIGPDRMFGIRTQLSFQQPHVDWQDEERKIDAASGDVSLLLRPIAPEPDAAVIPYLALGAGAIWYDMGSGAPTTFSAAESLYDGRSRLQPTGVVALGADIPIGMQWARLPVSLRAEVADHITIFSPLKHTADQDRHGAIHHIRFTIGMSSTLTWH